MPLHSSLDDRTRLHLKKKKKRAYGRGGDADSLCFLNTLISPAIPRLAECLEGTLTRTLLTSGMKFPPQAENIMFLELDVSPPAVFEMEFSHDQEQDPRALHMERLMRLDSFLERPSTSKVRKSRSWSVPSWSVAALDPGGRELQGWMKLKRVLVAP